MARTPEGWKLVWRRGIAAVRFTHEGHRFDVTTKSRDAREASERAKLIYADAVAGRLRPTSTGLVHPGTPIEELCTEWLEAIAPELGEGTNSTYTVYSKHWVRAFDTLGGVTMAAIGDYQRNRLRSVQRTTVVKERSALLRFLTWCHEREYISAVPAFPKLPKKALGQKHPMGRSKPVAILSYAEVMAILGKLRGKARLYYTAAYWTALRPSTLRRLRQSDITPFGLHIRAEVDKNRWERTVPLRDEARAALEAGIPFGRDYREPWKQAVKAALPGRHVTPYLLKHSMVTHLIEAGATPNAVAFLTGTEAALNAYNQPTRGAADVAIGLHIGGIMKESCEGGDLNPHGSYPASTSKQSGSNVAREKLHEETAENTPQPLVLVASNQNTYRDPSLPAAVRIALFRRAG